MFSDHNIIKLEIIINIAFFLNMFTNYLILLASSGDLRYLALECKCTSDSLYRTIMWQK